MDITAFTDRVDISKGLSYLLRESEDKIYMGASPSDNILVNVYKSALDEICRIDTAPTKRDGQRSLAFCGENPVFAEFVVRDPSSGASARLRMFYGDNDKYGAKLILLPGGHNVNVNGATDISGQVAKIVAHLRKPDTNKSKHSTRTVRIAAAEDENNPANY